MPHAGEVEVGSAAKNVLRGMQDHWTQPLRRRISNTRPPTSWCARVRWVWFTSSWMTLTSHPGVSGPHRI